MVATDHKNRPHRDTNSTTNAQRQELGNVHRSTSSNEIQNKSGDMSSARRETFRKNTHTKTKTKQCIICILESNELNTGVANGAIAARAHVGASRVCGTGDGRAGQRAAAKRSRHAGVGARARGRVSTVARLGACPVSHQARALRAVARSDGGLGRAGVGYTQANAHATRPQEGTWRDKAQRSAHRCMTQTSRARSRSQ